MHRLLICSFLASLVAALGLTAVVRTLTQQWGMVDRPDGQRKLHPGPVSLCGGVAVWLAVVAGLVAANQWSFAAGAALKELTLVTVLAAGIVCLFGVADDCWNLTARSKLLLQTAAVLPIVAFGHWFDRLVIFGWPIELGYAGVPLTVLWLLACINALNLLDGMDGLAAMVGLITAVMMGLIAHYMGHPHVVVIAAVLAGALAGFLVHNLPPARIFLGDSGSMVIGLIVGVLGIQGAMKTSATVAITVPAVVMSLPMLDTLLAIVRRKLTGRCLCAADREHIHHRLLERGMSQWQALGLIGGLCLVTSGAAAAASIYRHDVLAWITVVLVVVVMVRLRLFGHHEAALLGGAFVRRLVAAVGRLAAAGLNPPAPRRASLEGLSLEEAWNRLIALAEGWQLTALRLEVDDEKGRREFRWEGPAQAHAQAPDWSLGLAFALPDCLPRSASDVDRTSRPAGEPESQHPSGCCRLYARGRCVSEPHRAAQLAGLTAVLQTFGRHFARHAHQMPTLVVVEAGQAATDATQAAVAEDVDQDQERTRPKAA